MKKKQFVIIIALVCIAIAAVVLILTRENNDKNEIPRELEISDVSIDASANGIAVVAARNIAGLYVEDGSDEVLDNIFAVDFCNDADVDLQLAEIVLTIDGEEYNFKITTLPQGETVRAMEMNRKPMPASYKNCEMRCDHTAWFNESPSVHQDALDIVEQEGGLVIKNVSSTTINAPIYVFYKNYIDETYIGGITYRTTVAENLPAGEATAVGAGHFVPGSSKIMFVEYAG